MANELTVEQDWPVTVTTTGKYAGVSMEQAKLTDEQVIDACVDANLLVYAGTSDLWRLSGNVDFIRDGMRAAIRLYLKHRPPVQGYTLEQVREALTSVYQSDYGNLYALLDGVQAILTEKAP